MPFKLLFREPEKIEPSSPSVQSSIFHDYDIRGHYPKDVNEETFFRLAQVIVRVLRPRKVAIGCDSRLSSPALARSLGNGFLSRGVAVINAGLITSPLASWISRKKKTLCLMVTASHNSPDENGLKIYSSPRGAVSARNGLKTIEAEYKKVTNAKTARAGKLITKYFIQEYQQYLLRLTKKRFKNIRFVVDYSNGTAGLVLNDILDKLGLGVITLNETPNGAFPGHGPNPLRPEAQSQIKWLLKNKKHRFGVIFDGDGDRLAFFDERGELVSPAQILSLLTDFYLPRSRRSKDVVVTASFSRIIREVVKKHGGRVYFSPVGRTNVAPLMKKKSALLGAENSGHYFFKDFDYQDSGVLALLKVLEILAFHRRVPLSKLVSPYQTYITLPEKSLTRIPGTEEMVLRRARIVFSGGKISRQDGLTIEYKDWWFNLRPSRTEPVWRLSIEGKNREILEEKAAKIEAIVKSFEV